MRCKLFGRSGLRVSQVVLGAMTFGSDWGDFGSDAGGARQMLDLFAEAGGNFVDTADIYTDGTSEQIVDGHVRGDSDHWVVATKLSGAIGVLNPAAGRADINGGGNHRKNIVRAIDASLRRLGLDHIDVYYLHLWDFTTRPEEVMRALDDLVPAGMVLHPALSDTPARVVADANARADHHGWAPVVAIQVEYSLIELTAERELLPMASSSA